MTFQHTMYLTPAEVAHLARAAKIDVGPGSPLRYLDGIYGTNIDWSQPTDLVEMLKQKGALRADDSVNELVAGALRAAARPDELLSMAIGDVTETGFTIARRGRLSVECTVGAGGLTKLVTPLDRRTVLVALMRMLSGSTPDVAADFRFSGDAKQAFVLATALRLRREQGAAPTVQAVADAVASELSGALAASFKLTAGPAAIAGLVDADLVEFTVGKLVDAGHVHLADDALHFAPGLMAVSADEPSAMFAFSRSELVDGSMQTAQITVSRVGPYRLLFRSLKGGRFEWRDVTQQDLRRMVAAMWLTAEERIAA